MCRVIFSWPVFHLSYLAQCVGVTEGGGSYSSCSVYGGVPSRFGGNSNLCPRWSKGTARGSMWNAFVRRLLGSGFGLGWVDGGSKRSVCFCDCISGVPRVQHGRYVRCLYGALGSSPEHMRVGLLLGCASAFALTVVDGFHALPAEQHSSSF